MQSSKYREKQRRRRLGKICTNKEDKNDDEDDEEDDEEEDDDDQKEEKDYRQRNRLKLVGGINERRRFSEDEQNVEVNRRVYSPIEGTMDLSKKASYSSVLDDKRNSPQLSHHRESSFHLGGHHSQRSPPFTAHHQAISAKQFVDKVDLKDNITAHRMPSFLNSGSGLENLSSDPLRHLESLSKGTFAALSQTNQLSNTLFGHSALPFPHPGFPFANHLNPLTVATASLDMVS